AWNTGHPGGIATVHVNGAEEGLYRLEELIAEATQAPKQQLIGNAVDKIVFIERAPGGRQIPEVLGVTGYDAKNMRYKTNIIYQAKR
ncbi:MAG TPA: P-type conjugative transfer ATPase TrbB, partial [Desulfobulbaceae bacterium]|nr:P-type conjugative transfer ATPase TrbB [Desulfobulbaceae bacterium]